MSTESLRRLEPLIGEWRMETSLPAPPGTTASTTFEWLLGGAFLLQRAEVSVPEAPDLHAVITPEPDGGFLQHWFDSRGEVRLYAMTFDDGVWRLSRTAADFTPLDFCQRFEGVLDADGRAIRGRWEISEDDGTTWRTDFDLTYHRVG